VGSSWEVVLTDVEKKSFLTGRGGKVKQEKGDQEERVYTSPRNNAQVLSRYRRLSEVNVEVGSSGRFLVKKKTEAEIMGGREMQRESRKMRFLAVLHKKKFPV